jgi:hypothetical protein
MASLLPDPGEQWGLTFKIEILAKFLAFKVADSCLLMYNWNN